MYEKLISLDLSLFLFLNRLNNPWMDQVMYWLTKGMVWLPLFAFLLFLVIRAFRWKTVTVLAAVAFTIAVSDQLSDLVKNNTGRLRPSHQPELAREVHTVNAYVGGKYGFYSAHASNTFALAVFMIILFRRRCRYLWLLMLGWACLMTYTRIYLGLHYPSDVIAGAVIGSMIGWFTGRLTIYILSLQS